MICLRSNIEMMFHYGLEFMILLVGPVVHQSKRLEMQSLSVSKSNVEHI